MNNNNLYIAKASASFVLVLFTMPLGHALMLVMEHTLSPTMLHYSAFAMGLAGLVITVWGVFVKGETRQTICGLSGGLLFWTGWVEFLMAYYAHRYGTHCDLATDGTVTTISHYVQGVAQSHEFFINGTPLEDFTRSELKQLRGSRPEYLVMPSSFGFFMMFALIYICCLRTGCNAINWTQKKVFGSRRNVVVTKPMTRHTSIVTFMQLNTMLWALYLLLMFCYDPVFLGDSHPVTYAIAAGCLAGSLLMFRRQLHIRQWGANIRMSIATVIVLWTFVEVMARNRFFSEIWVAPMEHQAEMWCVLLAFILLIAGLLLNNILRRNR